MAGLRLARAEAAGSAVEAAAAHEEQLNAEASARAHAALVDTVQAQLRAAREASLEAAREAAAVRTWLGLERAKLV